MHVSYRQDLRHQAEWAAERVEPGLLCFPAMALDRVEIYPSEK